MVKKKVSSKVKPKASHKKEEKHEKKNVKQHKDEKKKTVTKKMEKQHKKGSKETKEHAKSESKKAPVKKEKRESKGIIFTTGKRKKAVARATVKPGSGKIFINGEPLENVKNEVIRMRLKEPFAIAGKDCKSYDFLVTVKGGGILGQAEAARQSIARGLVEVFGSELRQRFMEYDRNLMAYDPRRTEPHKPPRSSQGPRRYKQRSKR